MSPNSIWRTIAAAATGLALMGLAAGATGGGAEALALVGTLCAVLFSVGLPWHVCKPRASPTAREVLPAAACAGGLGLGGLLIDPAAAIGLAFYLALFALALGGGCALLGRRAQAPVSVVALAVLSLPYWGAVPMSFLDDGSALALTLHSPLSVICGTFAEVDVLRTGTLYQVFPLGQAYPYAYPTYLAAFGSLLPLIAAGWGLDALRRLRPAHPSPAPLAAAALVLVLVGAPSPAQAQLFPEPSQDSGEVSIGDMVTRVNLGYYVPFLLDGEMKVSKRGFTNGTRLGFNDELDLEPNFMVPTFEVALSWENGGLLLIQYLEAEWIGNQRLAQDITVEDQIFRAGNVLDTRYRFRTLSLRGEVDVPLNEYISIQILTTQRYLWARSRLRASPSGTHEQSTGETYAPVFGLGADILVYNQISIYGDIQYLDFSTTLLGGKEHEYVQRYREWRAGVRLELVPHSHVMVEFYAIDTFFKIGQEKQFKQDLRGVRVQVAILF